MDICPSVIEKKRRLVRGCRSPGLLTSATEDEVRDFCRGQIAHFKIPRYLKFVSEFPMTVTGKIQKFRMQEMAIEELGLKEASQVETA